nr:hypothetical protein [uncultured Lachnoclostridium sp.]
MSEYKFVYQGYLVDNNGNPRVPDWCMQAFNKHRLFYTPFGELRIWVDGKSDIPIGIGDIVVIDSHDKIYNISRLQM